MWAKDSSGESSMTTTLVSVAFLVFILKFLVGGVRITGYVDIAPMDSGTIAAYAAFITPLLGAYVARRNGWGTKDASDSKTS